MSAPNVEAFAGGAAIDAVPPPAGYGATDPRRELSLLVRCHVGLLVIDSLEEARAEALVADVAASTDTPLWMWSITTGLRRNGDTRVYEESSRPATALREIIGQSDGGLVLMRDLHRHLGEPVIDRLVQDIGRIGSSTIVTIGPSPQLPAELRAVASTWSLPRPDMALIADRARQVVDRMAERGMVDELDADGFAGLVRALRGLTLHEVDQVVTRLLAQDGKLTLDDVGAASSLKAELLATDGVLELVTTDMGLDWVAGFANMKAWAEVRARSFAPEAASFGLDPPRGVLLTGVPGCGKSFAVKGLAHDWDMPLLRLDAGSLYDKFIGGSEQNLRRAFETAAAMAPSILWIDEIEKGFAATGPSDTDGGLAYRLVGMLATWMQERPAPVFVAATSNNVSILPPELTRQGRFDETFFVDLPTTAERQHMFALQLARRGRDYSTFDCAALAAASEGFSGAEIEQAVVNAMYRAFGSGEQLATAHVGAELAATRPLSVMAPEKIESIRSWGANHARPA